MPLTRRSATIKRAVDLGVGLAAAPFAAGITGVAAVGSLITQGRPILYVQERVGRDGEIFRLYKLRTMRPADPASAPVVVGAASTTIPGPSAGEPTPEPSSPGAPVLPAPVDPATVGRSYAEKSRITPYGRFLRKTKIDELPQLWNLIRGDLSLVGPRPLLPQHVALVDPGTRHTVRPGLTCLAQLVLAETGYLDRHHQVVLDEEYVARAGLALDAQILWRTAKVLLRR